MRDNKIFSTGLANNPWIGLVGVDIITDFLPKALKDAGRTGIVDPREIGTRQYRIRNHDRIAVDHVDYAIGQAGFFKDIDNDLGRKNLVVAGLPKHHIAHHSGTGGQVGGDGRKVKRGNLSLIHISEPTRRTPISYAVFCLKKKK